MYKCPYPGCDYIAAHIILNSHAKKHGYKTVQEMTKVHGPVKQLQYDPKKLKHAREMTVNISESSFNSIESAIARLKKKDRSELRNRT